MRAFMRIIRAFLTSSLLGIGLAGAAAAQDISAQGGELTSDLPGRHAIQVNAPNVVDEIRRLLQISGFPVFHDFFSASDGLGPRYLSTSCGGCHINNGKGPLRFSGNSAFPSTMVLKVAKRGLNPDSSPKELPGVGLQIQDHAVRGIANARVSLTWSERRGSYPDGTHFSLRRPVVRVRFYNVPAARDSYVTSLRMTPAVIGPGLLESVSESQILEYADPDDADMDGISGRPNYVPNIRTSTTAIGRFGHRATNPTVEQQSAGALSGDMGLSTSLFPNGGAEPEVSEEKLNRLVVYEKIAGVPRARNQDDPDVVAGKALFQSLNCSACHRMTMTTGTVADPELSNQTFHPFTDLLLHDMGVGLADRRPEFSSSGREWKTPHLWGLGYSLKLAQGRTGLLHDGRARTIEEAILWHGGEAQNSRNQFKALSRSDRARLIKFLNSL